MQRFVLALFVFLALVRFVPAQTVEVIETTADQRELLQHKSLAFSTGAVDAKIQIILDPEVTYQTMDGFGASLTDSSAALLSKLSAPRREALMYQIFDPSGPLGLTLLRQPIGASDFSSKGDYSYDDPAGKHTDPALAAYSIAPDESYLFPLLREAQHLNPQLRVMALPWSAPAWMKSGHTMRAGSLTEADLQAYAEYFARTVEAYAGQGIPVWALALQNEPLNENASYPTQLMLPEQEARLAALLQPLLNAAGRAPLVFGYEHNWANLDYPTKLLADAASLSATPLFDGISFHCYAGNETAQSTFAAAHPGVNLWFTECSAVNRSPFAETFLWQGHHLLLGAPRNGARSVLLWNILLDPNGDPHNGGCNQCSGLLTLARDGTAIPTAGYYLLAHAAPFIHPGARRIGAAVQGTQDVEVAAYHNPDGTFATLALNRAPSDAAIKLSLGGQSVSYTLPARSLVTFVWGNPAPAVRVGTWRLAVDAAQFLAPGETGETLTSKPGSSNPNQLWTVRQLPSGRFEIRNVLTAQAVAVDRSGHLAAIHLRGRQVAALELKSTPAGFCVQLPGHADCAHANPAAPFPANTLLQPRASAQAPVH